MKGKDQTVSDQVWDYLTTYGLNAQPWELNLLVSHLVEILAQKGLLTPSDVSALLGETINDGGGEG